MPPTSIPDLLAVAPQAVYIELATEACLPISYDPARLPAKAIGNPYSVVCPVCYATATEPCTAPSPLVNPKPVPPHVERSRIARWAEMLKL